MRTKLLTALLLSLSVSSLQAADARFCDNYAQTSIKQQMANIANNCKQTGLRWSPLYEGQKAWCMTVRDSIASNENNARNAALKACGTDLKKLDWQKLPDIPMVWDLLFAQMLQATKKDDVVAVKVMHAHGVSIHHEEGFNNGAILLHAVDLQAEKVAEYLLDQGASPRGTTNGGGNALSRMIEDPTINYRMLAMLLRKGFDPNYGGEGYSFQAFPLLLAANKNDFRAVRMMMSAGGDPNLMRDFSPLYFAITHKNLAMVKLLVEAGAKLNVEIGIGLGPCSYPLNVAERTGSSGLISYLKSKGATPAPDCDS
jgi:ankyrin repeat protein